MTAPNSGRLAASACMTAEGRERNFVYTYKGGLLHLSAFYSMRDVALDENRDDM